MTDEELKRVRDDYDLTALIGKFMNSSDISTGAKDAIKVIARECFNIGFNLGKETK